MQNLEIAGLIGRLAAAKTPSDGISSEREFRLRAPPWGGRVPLPGSKKLALPAASGVPPLADPATPNLEPGNAAEIQKGRFFVWLGVFSTGVRG